MQVEDSTEYLVSEHAVLPAMEKKSRPTLPCGLIISLTILRSARLLQMTNLSPAFGRILIGRRGLM